MKNYLVITLGTREIQIPVNKIEEYNFEVIEEKGEKFPKYFVQKTNDSSVKIEVRKPSNEFPDFYTISPRTTGKIIDDNYNLFRSIIDFPIVRPAIEYLKQKDVNLDVIMLVYTDQEEAFKSEKVKFQNKENDSVYYADIISKLIKEDVFFANTEIDLFSVSQNVTDIGFQYDYFKKINENLLYPEKVKQVFLYPQGGIDQINQALTLRLIETFGNKVKQLQNAEGVEFRELDFPSKFLESLAKQQVLALITQADYKAALSIRNFMVTYGVCPKQKPDKLLLLAYYRYNLLIDEAKKLATTLNTTNFKYSFYNEMIKGISFLDIENFPDNFPEKYWYKLGDLFEKSRFIIKQENINEAVLYFHNFFEFLLNTCLGTIYSCDLIRSYDNYSRVILDKITIGMPTIYENYKDDYGKIHFSIPLKIDALLLHAETNKNIKCFLSELKPYIKARNKTLPTGQRFINDLRNEYAHEGKFIAASEIPYLSGLIQKTETIFGCKKEIFYEQINAEIEKFL